MKVLNNQQNNMSNQSFGLRAALAEETTKLRGLFFNPVERVERALPEVNQQIADLAGDTVSLTLKTIQPTEDAERTWMMSAGKREIPVVLSDLYGKENIVLEIVAAAKRFLNQ